MHNCELIVLQQSHKKRFFFNLVIRACKVLKLFMNSYGYFFHWNIEKKLGNITKWGLGEL